VTRRLLAFGLRHRGLILCVAAVVTGLGAHAMAQMYGRLQSELQLLLPEDDPAIHAVEEMNRRLPGVRQLAVLVRGPSGAPAELAARLAERIERYPKSLVRLVRVDVRPERAFFEQHAALYVPLDTLKAVRRRLRLLNPFYFELRPLPPPPPLAELLREVPTRDPFDSRFPKDRLESPDGTLAAVLIFTPSNDTGDAGAQALLERVRADVAELKGPGLEVGYAGQLAISAEELASLKEDLTVSTVLVGVAVGLALWLFYRRAWALPALLLPLAAGTCWAFGLASLRVPALNVSTAFLGSIVIGNGINAGIMLLARYFEERRAGHAIEPALVRAIGGTWAGTLCASAAAAAGYASLAFTRFRGFSQFGGIGALGALCCWLAAYLLMPLCISLFDRGQGLEPARESGTRRELGRRAAWVTVGIAACVLLASSLALRRLDASRIEYDMSKLRRTGTEVDGEAYWSRQLDALLGRNFTSVAFMVDRADQLPKLEQALRSAAQRDPVRQIASGVLAPDDLIPADQRERLEVLQAIHGALTPELLDALDEPERTRLSQWRDRASLEPVTPQALPELAAVGLVDKEGGLGRTVLLLQSLDDRAWNGEVSIGAARALQQLAATTSPPAEVAGGFLVSGCLMEVLEAEGPKAAGLALLAVTVVVAAAFRRPSRIAVVIGTLLAGVTLLVGALVALDLKLSFFNFIAFPITFGIGVEYAVNVYRRHLEDPLSTRRWLGGATGAVALCSATTIIGYASLLLASNRGLFSFGVLAVLGELCCLAAAVVALPAALSLATRRST
jgi:predicted RND superfamily exporter protein